MKVTIIDYGLSNLLSVQHAFAHFGAETLLTSKPEDVLAADALVLPGVGAFQDGMAGLEKLGLVEPIRQKAAAGTPLLGICLGMQMLFDESEEFGLHKGLGLIPGRVVKIPDTDADGCPQRVPHISWNPLYPGGSRADFGGTVLAAVQPGEECYFIHSYEAKPTDVKVAEHKDINDEGQSVTVTETPKGTTYGHTGNGIQTVVLAILAGMTLAGCCAAYGIRAKRSKSDPESGDGSEE